MWNDCNQIYTGFYLGKSFLGGKAWQENAIGGGGTCLLYYYVWGRLGGGGAGSLGGNEGEEAGSLGEGGKLPSPPPPLSRLYPEPCYNCAIHSVHMCVHKCMHLSTKVSAADSGSLDCLHSSASSSIHHLLLLIGLKQK